MFIRNAKVNIFINKYADSLGGLRTYFVFETLNP